MKLLYKLFKQNPEERHGIITMTSLLGIFVNVLLAAIKIVVGSIVSSLAIITEGLNGATDAVSSILTLVGTKLATKHPDEKHPFGYGRIEYLTGIVVSVLIIVTGLEALKEAVHQIFHPESVTISYVSIIILVVSGLVKLLLGSYTIKMGKKADSSALIGVGKECRSDSISSAITIVSALIFVIFSKNVDAYAAVITSGLIIKAGVETLLETLSEILGRPGEKDLADRIYQEIRNTEGIVNAADMMLHNYGPDAYSGSVNLEIDHKKSVGEIYQVIHELQLRIMHELKVTMVFGIYAVDNDNEKLKELRTYIGKFIKAQPHIKNLHALYIEPGTNRLYLDFVVDYHLKDWESLEQDFRRYMTDAYPNYAIELTIETEYV